MRCLFSWAVQFRCGWVVDESMCCACVGLGRGETQTASGVGWARPLVALPHVPNRTKPLVCGRGSARTYATPSPLPFLVTTSSTSSFQFLLPDGVTAPLLLLRLQLLLKNPPYSIASGIVTTRWTFALTIGTFSKEPCKS